MLDFYFDLFGYEICIKLLVLKMCWLMVIIFLVMVLVLGV